MVKGTLEVFLVESQGIKDSEFELLHCVCLCGLNPWNPIKMHPYIVVRCGDQELTSDVAHQEGKKLIWNEKLILNMEYAKGENKKYDKLVLRVIDKHMVSEDDYIGEATIYLNDVLSLGEEKGNVELRTQKYRVVQPDLTYSGEISLGVSFSLRNEHNGLFI